MQVVASPRHASPIALIRQGLNETGFVEGQNIALDCRWAEGQYDRLAGLDADLARQQVAVIVTVGGDAPALAVKTGTATIPIVFATGSDPVRTGIVTNLHRPGGNITGVSTFLAETEPKRLELLRELRPHATTPRAEFQLDDIQAFDRQTCARDRLSCQYSHQGWRDARVGTLAVAVSPGAENE
jgi:ABC-type uncharacterized transport system substrate-binding protein